MKAYFFVLCCCFFGHGLKYACQTVSKIKSFVQRCKELTIYTNICFRSNPPVFPLSRQTMQVQYNPFRSSATPSSVQSPSDAHTLTSHTKIHSRINFVWLYNSYLSPNIIPELIVRLCLKSRTLKSICLERDLCPEVAMGQNPKVKARLGLITETLVGGVVKQSL